MSEKKSPPHKDKTQVNKPLLADGKPNKRKLVTPASPTDDDDKKNQQKRKRVGHHASGLLSEGSPEHMSIGSPRGAGGTTVTRLSVPYSERQQMALLMRMQDESSVGADASPKSPSSGNQVSSSKRTPADKKVNKRNERGEAPLHMAARKGDYKQTKRLLKAGASVNMKDYAGWTALHEACNSGNLRVARYLLKAGADVNVQGFDDDTPLHDASSNGHRKLVLLLLRNGADPHQPNQKGKTPLKVAATTEIESILRNNSHGLVRDSDLEESAGSSSDSNLSTKEEERTGIEDGKLNQLSGINPGKEILSDPTKDVKAQSAAVKSDLPTSVASSTLISSTVPARRPSVPASPDKLSSSPRLFLKLQHKKTPSSSSSTDEQQRVCEWNVLPMEGPPEVNSSDVNDNGSTKRDESATWARVATGESNPANNCPDSTSASSAMSLHRTKTEPFTPRVSEFPVVSTAISSAVFEEDLNSTSVPLSSNSAKQQHPPIPSSSSTVSFTQNVSLCSTVPVGTSSNEATNKQLPPLLPSSLPSSISSSQQLVLSGTHLQQPQHTLHTQQHYNRARSPQQHFYIHQHKHNIPINSQTLGTYQGVRSQTLPCSNSQSVAVSSPFSQSSLPSISAGSSMAPSSSTVVTCLSSSTISTSSTPLLSFPPSQRSSQQALQSTPSSSCQFSLVSSSVSSSSSLTAVSGQPPLLPTSSATLLTPSSTSQLGPVADSRICVFPGRPPGPAKVGGGSIVTGLSDRAVAASAWDRADRSDTSSCDSPLRMDVEDYSGSRPSTPKVPPLKIIMPPKQGPPGAGPSSVNSGVLNNKGSKQPQSKPALPYVLNPSSTQVEEADAGGHLVETNTDIGVTGYFPPVVGTTSSRPSSRAGSGIGVSSSSKLLDAEDMAQNNLDLEDTTSRDEGSEGRAENTDSSGGKNEEGKRPTRTLRSHTAMLQQAQAKQETKDSGSNKPQEKDKEKNGGDSVTQDEGDNSSTTRSQRGDDSVVDDSNVPHRKRKLRTKTEVQTVQTASVVASTKMNQVLEKPPNPYETYLNLRRQIASRHRNLFNVAPKAPSGFKDFLMVNHTYVLQGNTNSTLSVPMLPPPNFVPAPMKDFFNQQEKERYRLRLQHLIEREKLMLSIEQEILREHGRAARAMANQRLPFSVCTILREEEIYNLQELEQVEDREKNVRSRYNGRQFISWLQAVDDKYEKIKQVLLLRHHHEAESLCAVQKLDWEWKLKECGLCDHKITPTIDDLHVPMVSVSNEFELPTTS